MGKIFSGPPSKCLEKDLDEAREGIAVKVGLVYPNVVIGKSGRLLYLKKIEVGKEDAMSEDVLHVFAKQDCPLQLSQRGVFAIQMGILPFWGGREGAPGFP